MFRRFVIASFAAHILVAVGLRAAAELAEPEGPDFDPTGALLGETMAVDLEEGVEQRAGAEGAVGETAPAAVAAPGVAAEKGVGDKKPAAAAPTARSGGGGGEQGGGAAKDTGLFGAVGDRAAADLATAFVRGFPQVASVDAAWSKVPFGTMAHAVIELELTEEGRIASHRVLSAPAPLGEALERTVRLLGGRKFTARGAKTKLVLKCVVSADTVHDGLHGEVFALGASFAAKTGNAFFALASGRRVDVDVSLGR